MAEMTYASNGKGNLGVTLGAIGTGLAALSGGNGLLNLGGNSNMATKDDVQCATTIAAKDSEIALLKAIADTDKKLVDVYTAATQRDKELRAEIYAMSKEQAAINAAQAVTNATVTSGLGVLSANLTCLQGVVNGITKTVVPITSVCPTPMPEYNSWTAPAAPTTT